MTDYIMTDQFMRMVELSRQGFFCSQILLMLGLEAQGKENTDLVRAVSGLNGGLGFSGKICGALTGGACLLGLYAGRGSYEEPQDERLNYMVQELVEWFEAETMPAYRGTACLEILENNLANRPARCPQIVFKTWEKVQKILAENGYDAWG